MAGYFFHENMYFTVRPLDILLHTNFDASGKSAIFVVENCSEQSVSAGKISETYGSFFRKEFTIC